LLELRVPPWANNSEQSPHLLERFQNLNVDSEAVRCRPRSSGFRRAGAIPKVTLDRTIDFRGFPGRLTAIVNAEGDAATPRKVTPSPRDHVAGRGNIPVGATQGQYSSWYWYVLYAWLGE